MMYDWLCFLKMNMLRFFVTSSLPVILDESVREDLILVYMESVLMEYVMI